jgi:hypothetical protein
MRIVNLVFIAIILVGGAAMALTGHGTYKGIHEQGTQIRVFGVFAFVAGLYGLCTMYSRKKGDNS